MLFDLLVAFNTTDSLVGYLKSWFGLGGTVLKWFVSINIGSTLTKLSKLSVQGGPRELVARKLSRLSFLSKLVERIVVAQIRPHIDTNDLGNTFQSAYKAGHSKETALLCIQNEIHLSSSKVCSWPWFSLTCRPPSTPLTMTHSSPRFGFTGTVPRWFTTYLLDHFQSVKIGSVISNCFKLNFGAPYRALFLVLCYSSYTPLPLIR